MKTPPINRFQEEYLDSLEIKTIQKSFEYHSWCYDYPFMFATADNISESRDNLKQRIKNHITNIHDCRCVLKTDALSITSDYMVVRNNKITDFVYCGDVVKEELNYRTDGFIANQFRSFMIHLFNKRAGTKSTTSNLIYINELLVQLILSSNNLDSKNFNPKQQHSDFMCKAPESFDSLLNEKGQEVFITLRSENLNSSDRCQIIRNGQDHYILTRLPLEISELNNVFMWVHYLGKNFLSVSYKNKSDK